MEEEYIDVRNTARSCAQVLDRFRNNEAVSARNKELVLAFVRDAALGKTLKGRGKKRVGPARQLEYVLHLRRLISFTGRNLDELTEKDMERFIEALDTDVILSRSYRVAGRGRRRRLGKKSCVSARSRCIARVR